MSWTPSIEASLIDHLNPAPTVAPTSPTPREPPQNSPLQSPTAPASGPQLRPVLGPTRPPRLKSTLAQPETAAQPEEEADLTFLDPQEGEAEGASTNPPPSPYTQTRTLLHNLTLPAHPNMDIPPSPPGTPPPGHDALTSKFSTFLNLKRTQGVHFNERLAASAGLKNPSICDKLMGFVGFETEFSASSSEDTTRGGGREDDGAEVIDRAVGQYGTVLNADVWDSGISFPPWAYKGPLRRAQERGAKERERGRGEAIEFVKASGATSGGGGDGGSGV
ncbi:hypothetical protein N657DRAFT_640940 [Parathielavia appendiculata]|uniref:HCNGP-like protein n=1 Tax=Parathielavia appendiculata TaxID=2587402 RepID=A0AAN6Z615_9PEZI|nr:hypothetical protein N657DRAFT_640940 [Parathielavia appendiculata]